MDITHLYLHVRDRARAVGFYTRWFGLAKKTESEDIVFLRGSQEFLLALMSDADPAPPPPWFHFGIRIASKSALLDLHAAMQREDVPIAKPLYEEPSFASFRCRDPDGYAIELYWQD